MGWTIIGCGDMNVPQVRAITLGRHKMLKNLHNRYRTDSFEVYQVGLYTIGGTVNQ